MLKAIHLRMSDRFELVGKKAAPLAHPQLAA